jgi:hypothetical protein
LTDKERQLIDIVVGRRLSLEKTGLKVVRLLERIITIPSDIPSDISMMFMRAIIAIWP